LGWWFGLADGARAPAAADADAQPSLSLSLSLSPTNNPLHPSPTPTSTPNKQQTKVYEPFYADFGPLNLGRAFRYCELAARLLQESDRRRAASAAATASANPAAAAPAPAPARVYHYCAPTPQFVANAAALAGIFQVMCLGRSAEQAARAVSPCGPFLPFRDASCGAPCFALTVEHVIKGVAKARDAKLLDVRPVSGLYVPATACDPTLTEQQRALVERQRQQQRGGRGASSSLPAISPTAAALLSCARGPPRASATCAAVATAWHLDVAEYEHYERVENGDANWILPGKILAFSGPASRQDEYPGFRAMTPEDYFSYFAARGITSVVRLNRSAYEGKRFAQGGFAHHELYFPDGSCPPDSLLDRFLALAEREPGALAVHCKAGLGRTGVLACAYLMKHYGFRAEEALGYIRVVRPGSVIGPQQLFLGEIEARMHAQGRAWRTAEARRGGVAVAAAAERPRSSMKQAAAVAVVPLSSSSSCSCVPPPMPVWGPAMGFEGLPLAPAAMAAAAGGLEQQQQQQQQLMQQQLLKQQQATTGRWVAPPAPLAKRMQQQQEDEEEDEQTEEDDELADAAEQAELAARRAGERQAAAALVREMSLLGGGGGAGLAPASARVTLQAEPPAAAASASTPSSSTSNSNKKAADGKALLSPRSAAAAAGLASSMIGSAVHSLLAGAASRAASLAAGGGGSSAAAASASPLTSAASKLVVAGGTSKGGAQKRGSSAGGGALSAAPSLLAEGGGQQPKEQQQQQQFVRVLAPNGQPRKVPVSMLAGAHGGVLAASVALMMGEEGVGAAPEQAAVSGPAAGTRSRRG
jgi:protein-tyrosine phosphatase